MRTSAFTGKKFPLENLQGDEGWNFSPPGESDNTCAVAEYYLTRFDWCSYFQGVAQNCGSLQRVVDGSFYFCPAMCIWSGEAYHRQNRWLDNPEHRQTRKSPCFTTESPE